jgi:hypothetical protein
MSTLQGQILRRNERREVAIFLRDGALWVADFVDGDGQLIDAPTWFRFNCGAASPHARHRMLHESATPLSADLVQRIERLLPRRRGWRGAICRLIEAIGAYGPQRRRGRLRDGAPRRLIDEPPAKERT